MRMAAGALLGLCGLAILALLAGFALWAGGQYTVGLSTTAWAVVIMLPVIAIACLAGSYRLLGRSRRS